MELQQSPLYLSYIKKLGWQVTGIDGVSIIYRHIFLLGGLAKIQRANRLPDIEKVIQFIRDQKIKTIAIEPSSVFPQNKLDSYCHTLQRYVKINTSPYLP